MMKGLTIRSVRIKGMHNVVDKEYDLHDIMYITGTNGAGKSTILDAIYLGLLKYIPNTSKQNASIFKHCNNGMAMSVRLTFSDDTYTETVWTKHGASVAASTETNLSESMQEELENLTTFPVFNFNEFLSMSANAQKDWFLQFLNQSGDKVDWSDELTKSAGVELPDDKLLNQVLDYCNTTSDIRLINKYIKSLISSKKSTKESFEQTQRTLVHYDDIDCTLSVEELKSNMKNLTDKMTEVSRAQATFLKKKELEPRVKIAEDFLSSYDAKISDIEAEMVSIEQKRDVLKPARNTKVLKHQTLITKRRSLEEILNSSGQCPYMKKVCEPLKELFDEYADLSDRYTEEADAISIEIEEIDMQLKDLDAQYQSYNSQKFQLDKEAESSRLAIDAYKSYKDAFEPIESIDEIKAEYEEQLQLLDKIQANNAFEELESTLIKDVAKFGLELKVLKNWDKLTGPNGIQTQLASIQFDKFVDDCSKYVKPLFGKDAKLKFTLESKANSFNFGLERNGNYLPFVVLSSGEKCLVTFIMMLTILHRCGNRIKVLMIDDLLDHLDKDNIDNFFTQIESITDVQTILAGVQKYSNKKIHVLKIEK